MHNGHVLAHIDATPTHTRMCACMMLDGWRRKGWRVERGIDECCKSRPKKRFGCRNVAFVFKPRKIGERFFSPGMGFS
jgi:hypothetical protein